MSVDGFFPRRYQTDSQGMLGPCTHHMGAGVCQGCRPVTQAWQYIPLPRQAYILPGATAWRTAVQPAGSEVPEALRVARCR